MRNKTFKKQQGLLILALCLSTSVHANNHSHLKIVAVNSKQPHQIKSAIQSCQVTLVAGGSSGSVTIQNTSQLVTALNIAAVLPASWTDVTQDASNCVSVPPFGTCQLTFTPGSTSHSVETIPIHGTNSDAVSITMLVNGGPITVSDSPLTLFNSGSARTLTINNTSTTLTATNIASDFSGTALNGLVTETGNTCASVAPSTSCTLTFTPGGTNVAQTSFPIHGTNTETATGAIAIVTPTVGMAYGGGIIACLNGGLTNLVVSSSDNSTSLPWGVAVTSGGTSITDGQSNTTSIYNSFTAPTPPPLPLGNEAFAAGLCTNCEIDSQGNSPCEMGNTCYNDWFLPADNNLTASAQMNCLYTNRANFTYTTTEYWSSTTNNLSTAYTQDFSTGTQQTRDRTENHYVRCVRTFTP